MKLPHCFNVCIFFWQLLLDKLVLQSSHLLGEDSDGSTQVPSRRNSASSSPVDSAFGSPTHSPVRPGAGAKVSWADLAEEAGSGVFDCFCM